MIRRIAKGVLRRARRRMGRDEPVPAPAPASRPVRPPPPDPDPVEDAEIDAATVATWVADGVDLVFVDVREPMELAGGWIDGSILIPMNQVPHRTDELPPDKRLVVYCAAGARSYGVASYLRAQGFGDAWSLMGGMGAWLGEGGQRAMPPSDGAWSLGSRVRVVREPLGIDVARPQGVVQAVAPDGSYTVGLRDAKGVPVVIAGLAADELEAG